MYHNNKREINTYIHYNYNIIQILKIFFNIYIYIYIIQILINQFLIKMF